MKTDTLPYKILHCLAAVSTMAFLVLGSVFLNVNNENFFAAQYVKNGTDAATGMSFERLEDTTKMLLDYLNDDRDDLNMQAEKHGHMSRVFDQREITHMVDVKNLYAGAQMAMYIFGGVALAVFAFLFWRQDRRDFAKGQNTGFNFARILFVIICLSLGFIFTVGFDVFWTNFHKVFFTNDLWILDPAVSTMINMFPLEFFLALCSKILCVFICFFCLALSLSKFIFKKYAKQV